MTQNKTVWLAGSNHSVRYDEQVGYIRYRESDGMTVSIHASLTDALRPIRDEDDEKAAAIEQYWQDKQGEEYGSF